MGTTLGGDHGDHSHGGVGMMWGQHGDDRDAMGMTWGPQGCGDYKITKNAITFEQIEIIQFYLKFWDP